MINYDLFVSQVLQTAEYYLEPPSTRDNIIRADAMLAFVHYWTRTPGYFMNDANSQRYADLRQRVNDLLDSVVMP